MPQIVDLARAVRGFLARAVRYLVDEVGIRQFFDIGTGLPTANNTHEVAQATAPECRIVYVDNDPLIMAHARALLTSTPEGRTNYIHATCVTLRPSCNNPPRRSTSVNRSRSCCWESWNTSRTTRRRAQS